MKCWSEPIALFYTVDKKDYDKDKTLIAISAGEESFVVNIVDDNIMECPETFKVQILSVKSCGFTIGSNNASIVEIRDNDSKLCYCLCYIVIVI